jgi:hypothetical protein
MRGELHGENIQEGALAEPANPVLNPVDRVGYSLAPSDEARSITAASGR